MLKLKQYLCKHNFEHIAYHNSTQQNLWQCSKCKVFCVQHYGINLSYKTKYPPSFDGWIYEK